MANEIILDELVDRGEVSKQLNDTISEVDRLVQVLQNARNLRIEVQGADKSTAELLKLSKAMDVQIKQTKEAGIAALNEAKAREANAKATSAEAKAKEASTKAANTQAAASDKTAKQLANEQKLIDQAIDDYFQLSKAYNEAALKAKNYVLRLGEGHPVSVAAIKDANDLGNTLKKLDATVGQNQRNVGNYKSAFDGLGFSFTQVARELPSLTISIQQFALAISNNLPMVADELAKAKEEINAMKEAGKDTPSLFNRIAKSLFSWQIAISLAVAAGTYLIGLFSKMNKESKKAAETQDEYAKSVDEARKSVAAEVADVEVLVKQIQNENLTKKERIAVIKQLKSVSPEYFGLLNEEKATVQDVTKAYSTFIAEINRSVEARVLSKQLDEAVDKRLKLEKVLGIGEKTVNTSIRNGRIVVESINSTYIEQAQLSKAQREYNEALEDESRLVARLAGLQKIKVDPDNARNSSATKDAENRLKAIFEINKIEIQQNIDRAKFVIDNEEESYELRLTALLVYQKEKQRLIDLEAAYEAKVGKKSSEELYAIEAKRLDDSIRLQDETTQISKKIQEQFFKELKLEEKDFAKSMDKLAADATKRFADEQEKRTKKAKEEADKQKQFEKDKADLTKELAKETTELVFTLFTAGIERQKNALQDQINSIEDQKKKDIDIVNQTVSNRQDAANQIAIIEATAQTKKEQLQRRQRELDIQKAKFDKAKAVADIIQNTAVNIVKFLGNPALVALAAAIGAVQLATVLAQPIPKYKDGTGTGTHKGGLAYVGDGGKHEGIELPDGTVMKSPNVTTLVDLPKGTKVHKDYDNMVLSATLTKVPTFNIVSDSTEKTLRKVGSDIVTAINNKPVPRNNRQSRYERYLSNHSYQSWVNRSVN